jgi:ferric-dicitrate binding protein FerR (iron transport regulator)
MLMLFSISQISAAQDTPVGSISKISGTAMLQRSGTEVALAMGMPVAIGDKIVTSAKAQVSLTFTDGSKAELGELTFLTIEKYDLAGSARKTSWLDLWVGRLRTIVKVATGNQPSFEVHTPNAVVAVRGTDFETEFVKDRPCPEDHSCMRYTTVRVSQGVVAVSNPGKPAAAIEVASGFETTVACESPPTSPAPLGMRDMGAPGYH